MVAVLAWLDGLVALGAVGGGGARRGACALQFLLIAGRGRIRPARALAMGAYIACRCFCARGGQVGGSLRVQAWKS